MPLVFSLDAVATSIRFAMIDRDVDPGTEEFRRLGMPILPEDRTRGKRPFSAVVVILTVILLPIGLIMLLIHRWTADPMR